MVRRCWAWQKQGLREWTLDFFLFAIGVDDMSSTLLFFKKINDASSDLPKFWLPWWLEN
jgi:hypothetical protein